MAFEIVLSRDPAGLTLHHPLRALSAMGKLQPLLLLKREELPLLRIVHGFVGRICPWSLPYMWPVEGMEALTSAGSRLPQKIPVASLAPPTGDNSTNPAHNGGVRQHPTSRRRLPAALL